MSGPLTGILAAIERTRADADAMRSIESAGPLTPEQRDRIATLLRPARAA